MKIGWRVFGAGLMALALVNFVFGNFDSGQPVPKWVPDRTALAYISAVFMLVAAGAMEWRRTAAWGAAALAAYFGLLVALVLNGRYVLIHPGEFGNWSGTAEQLAIAMGALIVYAEHAKLDPPRAAQVVRVAQIVFGVCAVLFGGAHFFYMNMTAPLVPKWLPPTQLFWGYATGIGHIAAGLAIIAGVRARLAAILLTVMYASFTPFVHIPLLLADHSTQFVWTENALNIILTGVAWVVADSFAPKRAAAAG